MKTAQEILTMYMNGSNGFFADTREQKIILNAMEVYAQEVAKNLHKPLVSNRRELLIRFLTDINCKELDKCNWIPNIPEVVDNYLKSN